MRIRTIIGFEIILFALLLGSAYLVGDLYKQELYDGYPIEHWKKNYFMVHKINGGIRVYSRESQTTTSSKEIELEVVYNKPLFMKIVVLGSMFNFIVLGIMLIRSKKLKKPGKI